MAPVSTKVSTSPAPPVKWSALARLLINLSGLFCFSSGTFFIELINNPLSRLGPPGSRLLHFTPCWWRYFSRLHFYCNFMPWCSSFELNFEQLKLPESHLERACRLYVIQRFGKCYNLRSSKSTQVSSLSFTWRDQGTADSWRNYIQFLLTLCKLSVPILWLLCSFCLIFKPRHQPICRLNHNISQFPLSLFCEALIASPPCTPRWWFVPSDTITRWLQILHSQGESRLSEKLQLWH